MRNILSNKITQSAIDDPKFVALTGDHGYALFDEIRKTRPEQFLNVGMIEQAMIGIAAGLTQVGHKALVYGLASFIPMRVIEQIKLDICYSKLPVKIIGDGAGLVYSVLGCSHHCSEDVSSLRALPNIEIYSPGDPEELRICFDESMAFDGPTYLRVGKCDNPVVNTKKLSSTKPYLTHENTDSETVFISTGAMLGIVHEFAKDFKVNHISIMKLKPIDESLKDLISKYKTIVCFEEHSRYGGLTSAITDFMIDRQMPIPKTFAFNLEDKFAHHCGSHQYALSEHNLSNDQMRGRLKDLAPEFS